MATTDRRSDRSLLRWCAVAGLCAPITFTIGWAAGGLAQPEAYSLVEDQISDLGALTADHAWIYNKVGANVTGILVAALALGLWRARRGTTAGRVGVIALGVVGVGVFFDGWLRLDCRAIDAGCSAGGTSWHATAHQIESLITVPAMFVAAFALASAFRRWERWQGLRTITLIVGVTSVAGILGGTILTGMEVTGGGLAMLVGLSVWFAWLALVALRLLKTSRAPAPMIVTVPLGNVPLIVDSWTTRENGRNHSRTDSR